ncbi:MAG TPA: hypothetical protein VK009_17060 [Chloroflexota bacterium]|nr:hypothetical protein [Chloroflexota bacterium]
MAFTVDDFQDLLRLLEQHPEWRAELRRQVLSEELLGLPELVLQLADRVDQLAEAERRTEERLDTLTMRLDALTMRVDALAQAQERTEQRIEALADQVGTLADRMGTMADRLGSIEGDLLEWRFEKFAAAYFSRLARRLRVVDRSTLADALDEAVDAGDISDPDREDAIRADLVLSGKDREGGADSYFVVEISAGVGVGDVQRASDRARIMSKLGKPGVPVVAGEWLTEQAKRAAADLHVRQIEVGRRILPSQN